MSAGRRAFSLTGDRSVLNTGGQDQVSMLTFFLSRIGLENALDADFGRLLEREGLLKFKLGRQHYVSAAPFVDSSGNDMWSVNVVVGDDDGTRMDLLSSGTRRRTKSERDG
jgi:hypothetical protein